MTDKTSKPEIKTVVTRMPPETRAQLDQLAKEDGRSVNMTIVYLIQSEYERRYGDKN